MKKYVLFLALIFTPPLSPAVEKHPSCQSAFTEEKNPIRAARISVDKIPNQVLEAFKAVWMIKAPGGFGSGFFISPNRFVTALHNFPSSISKKNFKKTYLSDKDKTRKIKIKRVIALSIEKDIALIETEESADHYLPLRKAAPDLNKNLFAIGYPSQAARIASSIGPIKKIFDELYFNSDYSNFSGISGGPVIDSQGRAAGVSLRGADNTLISSLLREFLEERGNFCKGNLKDCIKSAVFELKERALKGSASAQYTLSLLYEKGFFVRKSKAQAQKWLDLAAEQGHPIAQHDKAILSKLKDGIPLLRKSVEQGYAPSQVSLGAFLFEKNDKKQKALKSFIQPLLKALSENSGMDSSQEDELTAALSSAIRDGDASAERYMGFLLQKLNELDGAAYWFNRAAEKGHLPAMYELGKILIEAGRREEAAALFEQAAEEGDTESIYELGKILREEGKLEEAAAWLRITAKGMHIPSMYELGMLFKTKAQLTKSIFWLKTAGNEGHLPSMRELADILIEMGRLEEGAAWLRAAAEQNHLPSAYKLGKILKAEGDLKRAAYWLNKAKAEGYEPAARELEEVLKKEGRAD